VIRVAERVGRIGIHHQRDRAEAGAHRLDRREIPPRA
jgi:hypothetical protein